MNMRFYWIQDRVEQEQFYVGWAAVTPAWVITSPSITHQHITNASINTTFTVPPAQWSDTTLRYLYCEGVLIVAPALSPSPNLHMRLRAMDARTTV
jgi:hypothetical protein